MMSLLLNALLSFFCLMTFATSASAECAWVLWQREVGKNLPPLTGDITKDLAPQTQPPG
jgi:hypothetical protein